MLRMSQMRKSFPSRIASICTLASCCSLTSTFIAPRQSILFNRQVGIGMAKRRYDKLSWTRHMMSQSTTPSTSADTEPKSMLDDADNPSTCNPTDEYYSSQQFAAFESAIEEIISKRNVMRDFKKSEADLTLVKQHLLDRRRKLPQWGIEQYLPPKSTSGVISGGGANKEPTTLNGANSGEVYEVPYTKQKLRERSQMYLDITGLTQAQHKLSTVLLAYLADHCAKNSLPQPLHIAWEKILEAGLTPLSRTLSTYLYVLSLEDYTDSERDIAAEVALFHDALYEPTEKTITLLVKSMVGRGDAAGAEALLDGIADGPLGQLRHRTTSPILNLYCEKGDIGSALRLYHRMRSTSRVKMDAATYSDFIAAVAQHGYFKSNSDCILGADELGYSQSCGPELLDALLTEMAEDVLDISEESATVLYNGFASGFKECGLDLISEPDSMVPLTTRCGDDVMVANRVKIDKNSAKCPATDATLRLIVLEQSQRVHVHDTLLEMARGKSEEYTSKLAAKGRTTKDMAEKAELATKILKEFSEWLDTREGKPFTAIVDGANIAYFGWGRINVYQLIHMVNALEKQGEHPLVVFPQKYTRRKFHLRHGIMQVLKDEELELLEDLKEKGQMYVVPPMCLDDLYWMLASVSNQTVSTNGQHIDVSKDNTEGRFPGLRPMVISNDKMRDHKMDLLEERAFRRWCCSHIINYNFTEFIEDASEEREISFRAADLFSDEIQGNPCPTSGSMAWHLPVSDWDGDERFCLRLPS